MTDSPNRVPFALTTARFAACVKGDTWGVETRERAVSKRAAKACAAKGSVHVPRHLQSEDMRSVGAR